MPKTGSAPVSVVVPCFRCAHTIRRAINSVIQQTQTPTEIILVDDASDDNTLVVLKELEQQFCGWIKVLPLNENLGAAGARNAGWARATQQYIAFLDADDTWHREKIKIQSAYMKNHPEVVLCGHGHMVLTQTDICPMWEMDCRIDAVRIHKRSLLLSNKFITPSVMVRSDIHQRFIQNQRHMEDHMLWLEIICSGGIIVKLAMELAAIHKSSFGASGLSAQIWLMEKGDLANYRRLYRVGCIGFFQWVFLSIFSWLKFMRRLVICSDLFQWAILSIRRRARISRESVHLPRNERDE